LIPFKSGCLKILKLKTKAEQHKVNFYYPDKTTVSISINETTTLSDLNLIVSIFADVYGKKTTQLEELSSNTRIPETAQNVVLSS